MARDSNGRFVKGDSSTAGPGRKQGSKNKLPADLREKMLAISDKLETEGKGLDEEARKDPKWFYENFIKPMLPKNVEMSGEIGLKALTDDQLRDLLAQLRKSSIGA